MSSGELDCLWIKSLFLFFGTSVHIKLLQTLFHSGTSVETFILLYFMVFSNSLLYGELIIKPNVRTKYLHPVCAETPSSPWFL